MAEIEEDIERWYVIGARSVHREEKIRDALRAAGFRSHVPMKYEVRKVRRQEQRTMVPAITGLIFARGTLEALKEYCTTKSREPIYIRKSTYSNKQDYLTVRDDVMERFIEFTNIRQENITYFKPEELDLKAGEMVRIKGGIYDGYEATVLRLKGKRKKHLVVQIPGVVIAAIEVEAELVEPIAKEKEIRERPSKNVDGDKKYLLEIAEWMLANKPDKDVTNVEYNLKLTELKRTRARLSTIKGFTPTTEAELALPMYLAAVITGEDISGARARLEKATDRLKPSSKLKAKCAEILSVLSGDRYLAAAESPARYLSPDRKRWQNGQRNIKQ